MAPLNETTIPTINRHSHSHSHNHSHNSHNRATATHVQSKSHGDADTRIDSMEGASAITTDTNTALATKTKTPSKPRRAANTLRSRASGLIHRRRQGGKGRPRKDRRLLVEQHFNFDKENKVLLPGVPKYDDDLARDMHDFFNLIFLVPIVLLNILNWDWDKLTINMYKGNIPFKHCWTGEYYDLFFYTTVAYFVIDLLWILAVPKSVKSPMVIVQHHVAVFLYLIIPYQFQHYRFAMGLCMSVEVNTWFLIARRVFNKQGFPPWTIDLPYLFSVRVKLISICFYITWILGRCILYPYVFVIFYRLYTKGMVPEEEQLAIVLGSCLQAIFCMMNVKWTIDLVNSKIRHWRRMAKRKGAEERISSGL